jgi:hypothetical protein
LNYNIFQSNYVDNRKPRRHGEITIRRNELG